MTSTPFLVIVDDKRTEFTFGPTDWNTNTSAPWFNGTQQVPDFASKSSSNVFGTLSMNFQGSYVAFYGVTPTPFIGSQTLSVSIDGGEPTNTSYNDPNPPSYRQWYRSPTLPEGSHNISLSHIAGTSLDFAVVAVGNDTPLASQTAIVDNEDPAITFNGNWKRRDWSFKSSQGGLPFHNSTQDSTTIGDNLTFRFTGQSAAIYGIFTWSNLGLITLTFTLDNSSLSRTFQVTPTTPQFQNKFGQQQNFQFFSYDFLTPGNHTLNVNVTDCVNQTFSLDYITFIPSFSTLATKPNLTSLTDTVSSNPSSSRSKLSIGAIASITVAVILVVLGGAIFWIWRLWKKKSGYKLVNPFLPGRRVPETFPLTDPHLSFPPSMSNGLIPNTVSSRYTPTHIDNVNTQVTTGGPHTAYSSMNSHNPAQHPSIISGYDQHVHQDNILVTESGEPLLPPPYVESMSIAAVNTR